MKIKTSYIKAAIAVILCIIFLEILDRIVDNEIAKFDTFIYNLFYRTDTITIIMKAITFMGEAVTLIAFSIVALIVIKDKKLAWMVPLNLVLVSGINQILKSLIRRNRPGGLNLVDISGFGFPSGHTMSALAFYGFIIYLIYKKCKNKKLKILSIILLTILIILIGVSRIYLGAHYASDVVGAFAISLSYLIVFTSIIKTKFKSLN